jgi:hypothetical protein
MARLLERQAFMRKLVIGLLVLAPAVASAEGSRFGRGRWGIGLRTSAQSIENDGAEGDPMKLGGGGLHVRYRANPKWAFELTAEGLQATSESGAYDRHSAPVTISAIWHPSPERRWDWYLLAGLGGTTDEVTYRKVDGNMATETFEQAHVHFGVGVERRCGRLGLGVELRAIGLARDDEQADGVRYEGMDGPVPQASSGSQLNFTATYYF